MMESSWGDVLARVMETEGTTACAVIDRRCGGVLAEAGAFVPAGPAASSSPPVDAVAAGISKLAGASSASDVVAALATLEHYSRRCVGRRDEVVAAAAAARSTLGDGWNLRCAKAMGCALRCIDARAAMAPRCVDAEEDCAVLLDTAGCDDSDNIHIAAVDRSIADLVMKGITAEYYRAGGCYFMPMQTGGPSRRAVPGTNSSYTGRLLIALEPRRPAGSPSHGLYIAVNQEVAIAVVYTRDRGALPFAVPAMAAADAALLVAA